MTSPFKITAADKQCDCPPGMCLGDLALSLGVDADHPLVRKAAGLGPRPVGEALAAALSEAYGTEGPTVRFAGAYDANTGTRLDQPGEPLDTASLGGLHEFFGNIASAGPSDEQTDQTAGEIDENEAAERDFEKRTVVAQLVRSLENFGLAAATTARLVEETYEV